MIGGTAFFGKDIVRCLHDAGHSVTIFTRGNVLPDELTRFPHMKGDRTDPAQLKKIREKDDWDVVIDNIAYDGATIKAALPIFEGVKQYIFTSTISVYRYIPARTTQPLVEDAVDFDYRPPAEDLSNIHWKYAHNKMAAERELVRQDRVPWTILRPPIVYGPSDFPDRGFWYLSRLMQGGPILLANNGASSFRLAFSMDVAEIYLALIERPIALGRIYNVAQKEIITLRDFIDESAHVLGVKPQYVPAPLEVLGELGGPFAHDRNWIPDIEAATRDLGFIPTPWPDIAEISANWFRDYVKEDPKVFETRAAELEFAAKWSKR
jgi:nucleoside-diphosphate-sugar epimerase